MTGKNIDETKGIDKKTWERFEALWKVFQDHVEEIKRPTFVEEAFKLPKSSTEEPKPREFPLPPEFMEEEPPAPELPVEGVKEEEAPRLRTPEEMEEWKKETEPEKEELREKWEEQMKAPEPGEESEEDLYKFFDF